VSRSKLSFAAGWLDWRGGCWVVLSSFFVFPLHFASPFVSKSLNPKNHKQTLTPLDDDPSGEAVNLGYGVTEDVEWCDLGQVTTMGGAFVITMD